MSEALGDAEEAYCAYQRIEQLTSDPQQAARARDSRERLGLAEPIDCEERP